MATPRKRTAPRPSAAPELTLEPDKKVKWKLANRTYVLREPLWSDLRELGARVDEALADRRKAMADALAATGDRPQTPNDFSILADAVQLGEDALIEWWKVAFKMLERDGHELPLDDLPAWILDATLPGKVVTHWKTAPPLPGAVSR